MKYVEPRVFRAGDVITPRDLNSIVGYTRRYLHKLNTNNLSTDRIFYPYGISGGGCTAGNPGPTKIWSGRTPKVTGNIWLHEGSWYASRLETYVAGDGVTFTLLAGSDLLQTVQFGHTVVGVTEFGNNVTSLGAPDFIPPDTEISLYAERIQTAGRTIVSFNATLMLAVELSGPDFSWR